MEEPLRNAAKIHHDPKVVIRAISAGGHHSMLLTANGSLYTFGYSAHGQLGLHTTVNQCLPRLVCDFASVRIVRIAAGWHHSLVLTDRGDVYAAGHGAYGQLGLGREDSAQSFAHVRALGARNVRDIYAGGDHSWVVLDETSPDKPSYSSPSPLGEAASPIRVRAKDDTALDQALLNSPVLCANCKLLLLICLDYLQVAFTSLGLCHRFVRFLLPVENTAKVNDLVNEFIEELKEAETGMLYYRLKEDQDVVDARTKAIESQGRTETGQYYTLCVVVDPIRNEPPVYPNEEMKNEELIGTIIDISEETIKDGKGLDGGLSVWVKVFYDMMMQHCNEQPTFFELRPLIFKD